MAIICHFRGIDVQVRIFRLEMAKRAFPAGICPLEMAKNFTKKPAVKVTGTGHSTDTIALHDREDITDFGATRRASSGMSLSFRSIREYRDG